MEYQFRCSIVVSISACHAEDPGSIPGRGVWRLVDPPCGYPFRPGTTSVAHQLWSNQRPSRNAAPHRSSAWTSLVSKVSKVSNRNHCRSDPVRVQSTNQWPDDSRCASWSRTPACFCIQCTRDGDVARQTAATTTRQLHA